MNAMPIGNGRAIRVFSDQPITIVEIVILPDKKLHVMYDQRNKRLPEPKIQAISIKVE
jgi:hypothetical protein